MNMLPATINFSAFDVNVFAQLDAAARQFICVVLSASFTARPGQPLQLADEVLPFQDVDSYHGKPGFSSVRYDADTALVKPAVDILVSGSAYAPRGRPTTEVLVGLRFGAALEKVLRVHGDRFWKRGLLGLTPSSPRPFGIMPVVYERAYGGTGEASREARNPVGIGYSGVRSADPSVESEVANVEALDAPVVTPRVAVPPAGFGVVARSWSPRLQLAGTFDARWQREQFPLVPQDFDTRFNQAAPGGQCLDGLEGAELVQIFNMTPEGQWSFQLPRVTAPVQLRYGDHTVSLPLRTDTVILEPDLYRVTLKARAHVEVRRHRPPLEEVVVGHATRGWWRAREERKPYLAGPGRTGRDAAVKDFA